MIGWLILETGKQGTRYYLNGNFQQNDRQFCSTVLYPYMQNIFIDHSQCRIVVKGWEKDRNGVTFVCEQGLTYQNKNKEQGMKEAKKQCCTFMMKPTCCDDKCGFYFLLYWDDLENAGTSFREILTDVYIHIRGHENQLLQKI